MSEQGRCRGGWIGDPDPTSEPSCRGPSKFPPLRVGSSRVVVPRGLSSSEPAARPAQEALGWQRLSGTRGLEMGTALQTQGPPLPHL